MYAVAPDLTKCKELPFALVLFLALLIPITAGAADTPNADQNDRQNANIVRMVTGAHSFYEEDGTTLRGQEFFRMIAHPDGHRTMVVSKNMFSNDRQHNIVMRVDETFRPVDVFANYNYPVGYKGSVRVTVDGDLLQASSFGPIGRTDHEVRVPQALAVITHAEGLNAWNSSVMDPDDESAHSGPVTMARTSYFISPVRDGDGPVLGNIRRAELTRVGEETITVPAGTFDTIHYRTGILDVWAMKGDRILVKQTFRGENYLLTEFNAE